MKLNGTQTHFTTGGDYVAFSEKLEWLFLKLAGLLTKNKGDRDYISIYYIIGFHLSLSRNDSTDLTIITRKTNIRKGSLCLQINPSPS